MERAYVGVGANVDPERNILRALDLMTRLTRVTAASTFYRTPALDRPNDPDFVNGVLEVHTHLGPAPLRATVLRLLERWAGRVRGTDPYAPRPLDLDLLVHGRHVVEEPSFRLPDPDLYHRRFVAQPLLELAPALVLPDTGARLDEVLSSLPPTPMRPLARFSQDLRSRLPDPSGPTSAGRPSHQPTTNTGDEPLWQDS